MSNITIIYPIFSFLLFFVCAKISYEFYLLDLPSKRKFHHTATAYTGGIGISVAYIFAILIVDIPSNNLNLILSIGFLISIVGLIDDRFNLNVGGKLSLQIIPIFYLIVFENLSLSHIGEYNNFKLELGAFSIPFTLLSVLLLINAFNYLDGMDGTLSFSTISVLIILYYLIPNQEEKLFLVVIIIPIFIFLFFNFSMFRLPKMFLGDSGSLLIGFIISFTLIYFSAQNLVHPILLAWSIVIFVYEFLSINLIRLKNKKNPFQAGQDHLHHILFSKTKSLILTNLFIVLMNIFFFILGYLSFLFISPLASLILFIILFIFFLFIRNKYRKTLNY